MTRILDMPLWRAAMAAQAVLPHVSDDDVTPVLTAAWTDGVHLSGSDRYSVGRFRLQDQEKVRERQMAAPVARMPEESLEHYQALVARFEEEHRIRLSETLGPDGLVSVPSFEEPLAIPRRLLMEMARLSKRSLALTTDPLSARVRIASDQAHTGRASSPFVTVSLEVVEPIGDGIVTFRRVVEGVRGNFPPVHTLIDKWEPAEDSGTLLLQGWNLDKVTKWAPRHEPILLTPGKGPEHAQKAAPLRVEIGEDFVALIQPVLGPSSVQRGRRG